MINKNRIYIKKKKLSTGPNIARYSGDNLSGGTEECGEPQLPAMMADDVCPWDVADGGDKNKRPLPASISEERERRLSTSSSRKNSGGAAYDSAASADESQSDSVASRLRRSCGLGSGGSGSIDRRRGSSAACTPQQTVDRPSVSSAEDFDIGPSPESRSPEKQPSTSPHEPAGTTSSLDDKSNRKKLLKSLSLARKQSVTPIINVSSVDRDNGSDRTAADAAGETASITATVAECIISADGIRPGCGGGRSPEAVACCSGTEVATATTTAAASIGDGNDVCPWEDEHNQDKGGRFLKVYETYGFL